MRNLVRKILDNPAVSLFFVSGLLAIIIFFITARWSFVSSVILPNTVLGLYEKGFWENFLVEVHGIIFELSIIGVLLLWLDSRRTKSADIKRLYEELEDYSSLDFPEVNVRKLGHIRRLNEHNIKEVNIQNLVLSKVNVKRVEFNGGKLIGLKIIDGKIEGSIFESVYMRSSHLLSDIKNTQFINCTLVNSKFIGKKNREVHFLESKLKKADFTDADLQNCIFESSDLDEAIFDGANLRHANFYKSKNLSVKALARAANVDYVKIEDDILDELLKLKPDMKHMKKSGRPEGIEPSHSPEGC